MIPTEVKALVEHHVGEIRDETLLAVRCLVEQLRESGVGRERVRGCVAELLGRLADSLRSGTFGQEVNAILREDRKTAHADGNR